MDRTPRWTALARCLAGAWLLTACTAAPAPGDANAAPRNAIVYVIERGWHTDIGLPVEEMTQPLATLQSDFPGARFLTFGFGERQFVLSREVTLGGMLTALLPSRSAILMTALRASPEAAFGADNVVPLHVTASGLARLHAALWSGLEQTATGEPRRLAHGPYVGSEFYAARDTYDGFNTCNTWTASMLRTAGVPMPTAGVLFVGQVMGAVRWLAHSQTDQPLPASARHS